MLQSVAMQTAMFRMCVDWIRTAFKDLERVVGDGDRDQYKTSRELERDYLVDLRLGRDALRQQV